MIPATDPDRALGALLRLLKARGYRFVTPTPATHARVVARPDRQEARSLADALGWSLPFRAWVLDDEIERLLIAAGAIDPAGPGRWRSRLRVSSLGEHLFLHSAFPTDDEEAVFFGPDSYRFADLIRAELETAPPKLGASMVDIGAGCGVGAIVAATLRPDLVVRMTDVNAAALSLARINAAAAGVSAETFETDRLDGIPGEINLVTANPPYIIDEGGRLYCDGGGMHGGQVALDMARMALARLAPGGRLILYTGSAIVRGEDALHAALAEAASAAGCALRYRELDPDVFGEELDKPAYRDVDRIALVAAVMTRAS